MFKLLDGKMHNSDSVTAESNFMSVDVCIVFFEPFLKGRRVIVPTNISSCCLLILSPSDSSVALPLCLVISV